MRLGYSRAFALLDSDNTYRISYSQLNALMMYLNETTTDEQVEKMFDHVKASDGEVAIDGFMTVLFVQPEEIGWTADPKMMETLSQMMCVFDYCDEEGDKQLSVRELTGMFKLVLKKNLKNISGT